MLLLFNNFIEGYKFDTLGSIWLGPIRKTRDSIRYYSYYKYAVSYIRGELRKVTVVKYPNTFDDSLEPVSYNWIIFFENLIDKLCEFAMIAEEKDKQPVNVFNVIVHMLNDFVEYLNEELQVTNSVYQ